MKIVGGVYQEACRFPQRNAVFGSGLRAAVALSQLAPGVELHGFLSDELADDVRATLTHFGIADHLRPSETTVTFSYLHSIEKTGMSPALADIAKPGRLHVEGEAILQFGLVEAAEDVEVHGQRVVYDPQTPNPIDFFRSGSTADELVMIANGAEILGMAPQQVAAKWNLEDGSPPAELIEEAIPDLFDLLRIRAVLVKDFFGGLTLFRGETPEPVRRYDTVDFQRIGAGDVIAASFAYAWAHERLDLVEAADFSARCLAFASGGARLPIHRASLDTLRVAPAPPNGPRIRIIANNTLSSQVLAKHAEMWATFINPQTSVKIGEKVDGPHVLLVLTDDGLEHDALNQVVDDGRACVVFGPEIPDLKFVDRLPNAIRTRDFANALFQAMQTMP